MTEKEKMLRGMLYDADDSTLCADRVRAKELCHAYNQLRPSDAAGMRELLRRLLGKTGETSCVTAPFWCDYGYNIHIGEGSFVNFDCVFLDLAPIRIGRNTLIGPKVQLLTPHHPLDPDLRATGGDAGKPITIGDNCWLGGGVIVCPGVRIGNGAIIGAGSVVTRDIPADSVAVGNPARVTRTLSYT